MTVFQNSIVASACLVFIWIQCEYQAKRFAKQKTIDHWGKAGIFALFVALLTVVMMWGRWHNWRIDKRWLDVPIIGIMTRIAWFDLILSLIRHTPFFYNGDVHASLKGKSLQDWVENRLPHWAVKILKIVYIGSFFLIVIFLR